MLFSYPSFINQPEQSQSRLLYNNIKIALESVVGEIWYDVAFGTNIHKTLEHGIEPLIVAEVQTQIEEQLMKYFSNDIKFNYMDLWQEQRKIIIRLNYTELRTGKHNTLQTEQTFVNTNL